MTSLDFKTELLAIQDELLRFAYKLTSDPEEANDLLQETSLKALDNEEKFEPDTNFRGWMYTIMSNIFDVEYKLLVNQSSYMRFITVLITKTLLFLLFSIIVFIKKRKSIVLHKGDYILISVPLLISGILLPIVRNIIYESGKNYSAFFTIVLCMLFLIITQYYTILYMSKKNTENQRMSVMKKQIEMQFDNIKAMETKYDEIAKFRHDMKNHLLCAFEMSKKQNKREQQTFMQISNWKKSLIS